MKFVIIGYVLLSLSQALSFKEHEKNFQIGEHLKT